MESRDDLKAFIGPRIKELREARGLSQEKLAEDIGTTQPQIDRWENKRSLIQLPGLLSVVRELGVSLSEFWRVEGDSPTEERLIAARWMRKLAAQLEDEARPPTEGGPTSKAVGPPGSPDRGRGRGKKGKGEREEERDGG